MATFGGVEASSIFRGNTGVSKKSFQENNSFFSDDKSSFLYGNKRRPFSPSSASSAPRYINKPRGGGGEEYRGGGGGLYGGIFSNGGKNSEEISNINSSFCHDISSPSCLSVLNKKENLKKFDENDRSDIHAKNEDVKNHFENVNYANDDSTTEFPSLSKMLTYKHPSEKKASFQTRNKNNEDPFVRDDNQEESCTCNNRPLNSPAGAGVGMEEDELFNDYIKDVYKDKHINEHFEREKELAKALWKKQNDSKSVRVPMGRRFPKERKAFETNDDWAIFSLHCQYVRPNREHEWLHGEPARIRRGAFDLPPGAVEYLVSTNALPATSWEPFVFANPPRDFFCNRNYPLCTSYGAPGAPRKFQGGFYAEDPLFSTSACYNNYDNIYNEIGHNGLSKQDLCNLERMIWMDPEPRFERPYRVYADPKYCLKGCKVSDIGFMMRPGW